MKEVLGFRGFVESVYSLSAMGFFIDENGT
jgi:hypothetical protein